MRYSLLTAVTAVTLVTGHAGVDRATELKQRRDFLSKVERTDLAHCADRFKARGLDKLASQRRKAIRDAKYKRGIIERAPEDLNKSHHSEAEYNLETPLDVIFGGNTSCLLSPEATEGPYYVAGEYIRENLAEDQKGVQLVVDLDIFDVETCEPVPEVYVEIWSCNSTGIYSGVPNGGNYTDAPINLATTFLRGFQKTDEIGAVQFEGVYPGHYEGRTQHIHVMVHPNATARENGTIVDLTSSHVGQVYFDEDLNLAVELTSPYNTNTQVRTPNSGDFHLEASLESSDPLMQYVLLGEDVEDGVLAWISFGINSTYTRTVSAAATYYEGGGVANPGNGGPPGDGPGGPGGPPPSGTELPPTDTAVPSA